MLYEVVRAVVQRVLRDKILLGLVIVAILGVWVGGMTMNDDKADSKKQAASDQAAAPNGTVTLAPKLASDFVSWWLTSAMDLNPQSAEENHQKAILWMTVDAGKSYLATYWTPEIREAVNAGRLVGGFQPTAVVPQAINPDGSVVVGVSGTMVVQSSGQPSTTQPFLAAFLVKQDEKGNMRIAGLDARSGVLPGSTAL